MPNLLNPKLCRYLQSDLRQENYLDCLPAAYRILSGKRLIMPVSDIGDELKTMVQLRRDGVEVNLVCRDKYEYMYSKKELDATALNDVEYLSRVESIPSILVIRSIRGSPTNAGEHAVVCIGRFRIDPRDAVITERPEQETPALYFGKYNNLQIGEPLAAFLFPRFDLNICEKRIYDSLDHSRNG